MGGVGALGRGYSRVRRNGIEIEMGKVSGELEKGYVVGVKGGHYMGSPSQGRLYFVCSVREVMSEKILEKSEVDRTRGDEDWEKRASLAAWCTLFKVRANATF